MLKYYRERLLYHAYMLMYDSRKTLVFRKSNLQQNEDIYENPLSSSIFNQDNIP